MGKGLFYEKFGRGATPRPASVMPSPVPRPQQIAPPQQIARRKYPQQIAGSRLDTAPLKYQLNQTTQVRSNAPLSMTKQGTAHPQQIAGTAQGMRKYSQNPEQMFV